MRRASAGDVTLVEDAYILCEGGRITGVGPMRGLGALAGDVEELDGSGRCAVPGLVDCHTHACFVGDRVEEFALRARGATYEELHAAGGGILSTVEATRAADGRTSASANSRYASPSSNSGGTVCAPSHVATPPASRTVRSCASSVSWSSP